MATSIVNQLKGEASGLTLLALNDQSRPQVNPKALVVTSANVANNTGSPIPVSVYIFPPDTAIEENEYRVAQVTVPANDALTLVGQYSLPSGWSLQAVAPLTDITVTGIYE